MDMRADKFFVLSTVLHITLIAF